MCGGDNAHKSWMSRSLRSEESDEEVGKPHSCMGQVKFIFLAREISRSKNFSADIRFESFFGTV